MHRDDVTTHLDEGTVHAWLDGALTSTEAARAETHVATCAPCAARVAEARGLIAGATRVLSALDDVPGDVVPASPTHVPTADVVPLAARRRRSSAPLRAAAAVLVMAGATAVVLARRPVTRTESMPTGEALAGAEAPLAPPAAPVAETRPTPPLETVAAASRPRADAAPPRPAPPSAVGAPVASDAASPLERAARELSTASAPVAAGQSAAPPAVMGDTTRGRASLDASVLAVGAMRAESRRAPLALPLAAKAAAPEPPIGGCYALARSAAWSPPDRPAPLLPTRVRLPVPPDSTVHWSLGADTLAITLGGGVRAIELRLTRDGDAWRGPASARDGLATTLVRLTREPCEP